MPKHTFHKILSQYMELGSKSRKKLDRRGTSNFHILVRVVPNYKFTGQDILKRYFE